jgi:FG-GAP repeat
MKEAWFVRRRSTLGPRVNEDSSAHHRRSRSALAVLGVFLILGTLLGAAASALASGAGLSRAAPVVPALAPAGADEAPLALLAAIHRAKLTASDGAASDEFGFSVAVSGDTAVVGAPYDDTPAGTDAGSAYVFVRSGNVWTERVHLRAPDGAAYDGFGLSVSVSGATALVGAFFDTTPAGFAAGSAYIFRR